MAYYCQTPARFAQYEKNGRIIAPVWFTLDYKRAREFQRHHPRRTLIIEFPTPAPGKYYAYMHYGHYGHGFYWTLESIPFLSLKIISKNNK